MDFSQDFGTDLLDLGFASLDNWEAWLQPVPLDDMPTATSDRPTDVSTPSLDDSIGMGSAAFRRSAWRWEPNHEQGGQVPHELTDHGIDHQHHPTGSRRFTQKFDDRSRDRVIATLLAVCDGENYDKFVTSFPPTAVLDVMINDYLASMHSSIEQWIHIPSLKLSECKAELLAMMIAGGAIRSPVPQVQKFGKHAKYRDSWILRADFCTKVMHSRNWED
jgi:hypothetical protein